MRQTKFHEVEVLIAFNNVLRVSTTTFKNLNRLNFTFLIKIFVSENIMHFLIVGATSSNNTRGFLCICVGSQDKGIRSMATFHVQ